MGLFDKAKSQAVQSTVALNEDTLCAFAAAKGDKSAFEKLMKKYEKYVCTTAFSVVKNYDDSFDVAQEVFLKLYHNIGSFKGESSFSSWLYRIAKNTALDFLRKNKNLRKNVSLTFENDDGEEKILEIADKQEKNYPEESMLKKELGEIINACLDDISEVHKEIIVLRYMCNYSYEEIAKMLSIEEGTVKSRLFRAREALREKLMEKNYF